MANVFGRGLGPLFGNPTVGFLISCFLISCSMILDTRPAVRSILATLLVSMAPLRRTS
jgi:hypothetical protein